MHTINKELARIFEDMGSIYEFLGEENRFRSIAYHHAAAVLNDLSGDIQSFIHDGEFEKVHGIGESIGEKIQEYLKTRSIKKYEELKKAVPYDFIDLMKVQGLGPETLKYLHEELKVSSRKDLIRVLEDGSALKLKGFKEKKVKNILEALDLQKSYEQRVPLWNALDMAETIILRLKKIPEIIGVDIAGSVRRGRETIGDVDILIAAKAEERKKIIAQFIKMEDVSKVLAEGETKASIYLEHFNRQVDLRIVAEDEWGAALQYFTGSKAHNIHLRKIAIEKGMKINEYGLFMVGSDQKIAGETEEGIYEKLGLRWIPPEMREDSGEIELAASGKIPQLISLKDIKGDMHTHSKWSDGSFSLDEIAEYAAKNLGYDYLVITDHSKTEIIAGGLDESEFEKQILEIREINKKQKNDLLKTGAEVDILADGTLDLSDELLKKLDWVVAAIHIQFKRDVTDRIISACENPFVNAIAHPSGRLLGIREPYEVDLEKVIKVAASTGTALEINAHALRMDLDSKWARIARDKGVKLVIGTDAHNNDNYTYMKLGVLTARRAWCKAEDILNTRSWAGIVDFKNEKLKKRKRANALMNF